jgi:Putative prokaryotic signal transducing protein
MTEQGNWTLVFSAGSLHEAELVKGRLGSHGITALLMDNGVSAYPHLGEVGVYVERVHVLRALHIVRNSVEA